MEGIQFPVEPVHFDIIIIYMNFNSFPPILFTIIDQRTGGSGLRWSRYGGFGLWLGNNRLLTPDHFNINLQNNTCVSSYKYMIIY